MITFEEEGSGIFTAEEVESANIRHDRYYGFSFDCSKSYANQFRFPESDWSCADHKNKTDDEIWAWHIRTK